MKILTLFLALFLTFLPDGARERFILLGITNLYQNH